MCQSAEKLISEEINFSAISHIHKTLRLFEENFEKIKKSKFSALSQSHWQNASAVLELDSATTKQSKISFFSTFTQELDATTTAKSTFQHFHKKKTKNIHLVRFQSFQVFLFDQ